MRFHVGFSFRARNIKKFLIPFLLGLGAYFGLSSFNLLQVKAYGNLDTYFNFEVDEQDFSNVDFFGTPMQDLLDLGLQENEYFYINTRIGKVYNGWSISFALYPKNANNPNVSIYNNKGSSSGSSQLIQFYDYSYQSFYEYFLGTNSTEQSFNTDYNNLVTCLTTNLCNGYYSTSQYVISDFYTDTNVNNYDSYNINVFYDGSYYYNNQLPVINRQQNMSDNWYYVKSIKVNDTLIEFNDYLPSYCDLYNCGGHGLPQFEMYLSKLPFIYTYIEPQYINNYETTISFIPVSLSVEDYQSHFLTYKDFFGRVDHGTYYSYEKINCSLTSTGNSDDTTINLTFNNLSCTSNISSYDKIFVSYYFNSDNNNLDYSISNFITSSTGFITFNVQAGNDLVDDFYFNRGFNVLLSTNVYNSNDTKVYLWTDNDYVVADTISNSSSLTEITTNGRWYKEIPIPHKHTFGLVTNTNLMIYDDISYTDQEHTNLYLFLSKDTIVSIGNNNDYTYYDSNGNLVNNTIITTYDTIEDNGDWSAIDTYTQYALDYLVSMQQEIYTLHNVINNIYDSIPLVYRSFIFVLFVIGLLYILYREVRR